MISLIHPLPILRLTAYKLYSKLLELHLIVFFFLLDHNWPKNKKCEHWVYITRQWGDTWLPSSPSQTLPLPNNSRQISFFLTLVHHNGGYIVPLFNDPWSSAKQARQLIQEISVPNTWYHTYTDLSLPPASTNRLKDTQATEPVQYYQHSQCYKVHHICCLQCWVHPSSSYYVHTQMSDMSNIHLHGSPSYTCLWHWVSPNIHYIKF